MLLDMASLPLGYYFLYRLYGLAAIAVSILANAAVTALTARLTTQKSIAQGKLRDLAKKQEAIYHDLAANLPIWKFYGWSNFFVSKLCANNVMCLELTQLLEVVSLLLLLAISRWLLCLWMHVRVETS